MLRSGFLQFSFLSLVTLFPAFFRAPQYGEELMIYMIGDSTMADRDGAPGYNPERGWGQYFFEQFESSVTVENHAKNGRSSKSFIDEGLWDEVYEKIEPGDYVFIQFGHNDQKEYDPARYTNPWTGYRKNLEKFVDETLERGGNPVILSSIVRRKFNDEGTLVDTHGVYPFVARLVAEQRGVPFIDMQLLTEDYVRTMGMEESKKLYLHVKAGEFPRFPEGKVDDTHLSLYGAREFSRLVADEINKLDLPLKRFLRTGE